MKNLLLTFIILFGLAINSCSSNEDDSSTTTQEELLIGNWYSEESADPQTKLQFNSNGRHTITYFGFGNNGQDISESGDWMLQGNLLKVHWDDAYIGFENWSAEILELSSTTLKWKEYIDGQYYTFTFYR